MNSLDLCTDTFHSHLFWHVSVGGNFLGSMKLSLAIWLAFVNEVLV